MLELITVTFGGTVLRFTGGDLPTSFDGNTYNPIPIFRSTYRKSSLEQGEITTFTVARGNALANLYEDTSPLGEVFFEVYNTIEDKVILKNRVIGARWVDNSLEIETVPAPILTGTVVRGNYGRQCRWTVYDTFCDASITWIQATFFDSPTPHTVRILTPAAQDEDVFSGGIYAPSQTPEDDERITVLKSYESEPFGGGHRITLVLPGVPNNVSSTFSTGWLARGCPKTVTACDNLFSNLANFGGNPEIKRR